MSSLQNCWPVIKKRTQICQKLYTISWWRKGLMLLTTLLLQLKKSPSKLFPATKRNLRLKKGSYHQWKHTQNIWYSSKMKYTHHYNITIKRENKRNWPMSLERLLMSSWTPSFPSVSFKYIAADATSSGVTFPS